MLRVATFVAASALIVGVATAEVPCPGDLNGDGHVDVTEIIQAVNAALNDCGPPTVTPTPAPTFTPTPDGLEGLLGKWSFTYKLFGTTVHVGEEFIKRTVFDGHSYLSEDGFNPLVGLAQDLGAPDTLGYRFGINLSCDFMLFDLTDATHIAGVYVRWAYATSGGVTCGEMVGSWPLTAVRTELAPTPTPRP